ncbi:mechanosensitive ion channel family protein [Erwinia sp. HR93]|uniref:mechanosensitive ion channel family protein n=1 Tax=Erwinia sp. HR93 TaxID=3094840 RepID=UPI002ADEF267|nr:mechanosensitive ion channel family protein [Erwinia sp. HR93]MEA1064990.1 mechanosensitive ion channel family protein [Erwinia sp. HR93]
MTIIEKMNILPLLTSVPFWTRVALVLAIALAAWGMMTKVLSVIRKALETRADSGRWRFIAFDVLNHTNRALIFIAAFLISLRFAALPPALAGIIAHAWFLVLAVQVAIWFDRAITSWMAQVMQSPGGGYRNPVTLIILTVMLRVLVWAMMLLSILGNVGVDITALVASLGVGGIAIALAVQTVLSDIFASLAIGFDKPFEIGDFIVFNDVSGTIEHIGLKTTRIRSLSGEQIVCGNAILLQQTIHNYKRMQTRRVVFTFGIAINTPPEKLRKIGEIVKLIVNDVGDTQFDRAHFSAFDSDRLTFEVVYIVSTADYNKYMDLQQEINIRLMETLAEQHIRLAVPNLSVSPPESAAARPAGSDSGVPAG